MAKKEAAKTVETKTVNTGFIDNVEALEAKMKEMREAQKIFATFTQEQVDKIFYEAAMAANKQRIPLARLAVEETQRGILEDKVIKNHYAAEYIYNAYKDTKTCGVVEEDKAFGIKKIAEPIGLVAAVIPTTNPQQKKRLTKPRDKPRKPLLKASLRQNHNCFIIQMPLLHLSPMLPVPCRRCISSTAVPL